MEEGGELSIEIGKSDTRTNRREPHWAPHAAGMVAERTGSMLGVGQAQEIQGQPSDPWVRVGVYRAKIVRRVTCRRNHRQHSGAVGRTQGLGARERTGGAHRGPVGAGRTWQGRRTSSHISTHLARDWSQKQRKQDVLTAATRFQRVPALLRAPQVLLRDGQAQLGQQRVLVGLAVVVDRDLEMKHEKKNMEKRKNKHKP